MPTLEELQAAAAVAQAAHEAAQLAYARATAETTHPLLQAAHELLTAPAVTGLIANVQAIQDQLPAGEDKIQMGNIVNVLTTIPTIYLPARISKVSALLPAQEPEGGGGQPGEGE